MGICVFKKDQIKVGTTYGITVTNSNHCVMGICVFKKDQTKVGTTYGITTYGN